MLRDKINTEADGEVWSFEKSSARNYQPTSLGSTYNTGRSASSRDLGSSNYSSSNSYSGGYEGGFQDSSSGQKCVLRVDFLNNTILAKNIRDSAIPLINVKSLIINQIC